MFPVASEILDRLITSSTRYRWLIPVLIVVGVCAAVLTGIDLVRDNDLGVLMGLKDDQWIIPASVVTLWTIMGLWMLTAFPTLPLSTEKPENRWPRFKYFLWRGFGYLLLDFAALLLLVSLYTSYRMLAFWF
ncbi:MAG: hypothetical protein AAF525_14860 [Pseudomonadota bacterium]